MCTTMDEKEILEKIIEEDGDCMWVMSIDDNPCGRCPLGKLRRHSVTGSWLSCAETVMGRRKLTTLSDANILYKDIAIDVLSDILIKELILSD